MKLGRKLMAVSAVSAGLTLMVLAGSVWVLKVGIDRIRVEHERSIALASTLADSKLKLAQQHVALYRGMTLMASLNDDQVKKLRADLARDVGLTHKTVEQVTQTLGATDDVKKKVAALNGAFPRYVKAADSAIDMATVDANTGIAAMQSADAEFSALKQALDDMAKQAQDISAQAEAESMASTNWHESLLALLSLGGCGLAVAFMWVTQRRVLQAIGAAVSAAQDVAHGRFDQHLKASSDDELGDLMRSLDGMVRQLSSSLLTVRQAAQRIGSASDEIATGNHDLSVRTEQTAANLQEAASSMDELTTTVRSTAEAARSANSLVSTASGAAAKGGQVMSQVVANMGEINQASHRITEIISTIDGIAFQTNILALNAAVEAARAGEQGRGFAVVAGEVRLLAQRSAQAAKEIKTLIATSSERVELGSRLVREAGSSMQDIVSGVQQVNVIISEIMNAADQESQGISLVNQTVGQLDQMTQQNAALVEQSAAASDHLRQQAQRLTSVVAMFKLEERAEDALS